MRLEQCDLNLIEALVKRLGSQDKAARVIGVSERTLGRYRNGTGAPISAIALSGFRSALGRAIKKVEQARHGKR